MQHPTEHYTHSNTLLLRGLHGRSESTLRALFEPHGALRLVRCVPHCNVALVVYALESAACRARESLVEEDLVYTKVRTALWHGINSY